MNFHAAKKIISGVVIICFLVSEAGWTAPSLEGKFVPEFFLPEELGKIQEIHYADPDNKTPFIFHLETPHAHYESALKIKEIIQYLKKQYEAEAIFSEGAAGKLHPEFLQFFKVRALNQKMIDALAQKGELTGVDLALASEAIPAFGVERPAFYRFAYQNFKKVLENSDQSEAYINRKKLKLDQQASKVFSHELREILSAWQGFNSGHKNILGVIGFLRQASKKFLQLDFEDPFSQFKWPEFTRLVLLDELEKRMNVEKFEEEKERLSVWLDERNLSKEIISALGDGPKRDRPGKRGGTVRTVPKRSFFENFLKKTYPLGFRFHDYPQITYRAAAQVFRSELDAYPLFKEFDKLFDRLFEATAKTGEEKRLIRAYQELALLEKLLRLELSREEWERVNRRGGPLRPPFKSDTWGTGQPWEVVSTIESARHFYHLAARREKIFLRAIQREMTNRHIQKAILVTGGFHSEGLSKLFKEKGVGFAAITPHVAGEIDSSLYHQLMLRKSHLEKPEFLLFSRLIQQLVGNTDYLLSEKRSVQETAKEIGPVNFSSPYFFDRSSILSLSVDERAAQRDIPLHSVPIAPRAEVRPKANAFGTSKNLGIGRSEVRSTEELAGQLTAAYVRMPRNPKVMIVGTDLSLQPVLKKHFKELTESLKEREILPKKKASIQLYSPRNEIEAIQSKESGAVDLVLLVTDGSQQLEDFLAQKKIESPNRTLPLQVPLIVYSSATPTDWSKEQSNWVQVEKTRPIDEVVKIADILFSREIKTEKLTDVKPGEKIAIGVGPNFPQIVVELLAVETIKDGHHVAVTVVADRNRIPIHRHAEEPKFPPANLANILSVSVSPEDIARYGHDFSVRPGFREKYDKEPYLIVNGNIEIRIKAVNPNETVEFAVTAPAEVSVSRLEPTRRAEVRSEEKDPIQTFFEQRSNWKIILDHLQGMKEEGLIHGYGISGSFSRGEFKTDGTHDLDLAILPRAGVFNPEGTVEKYVNEVNEEWRRGGIVHLTLDAYGPSYRYDETRGELQFDLVRKRDLTRSYIESGQYGGERIIDLTGKEVNAKFLAKLYNLIQGERRLDGPDVLNLMNRAEVRTEEGKGEKEKGKSRTSPPTLLPLPSYLSPGDKVATPRAEVRSESEFPIKGYEAIIQAMERLGVVSVRPVLGHGFVLSIGAELLRLLDGTTDTSINARIDDRYVTIQIGGSDTYVYILDNRTDNRVMTFIGEEGSESRTTREALQWLAKHWHELGVIYEIVIKEHFSHYQKVDSILTKFAPIRMEAMKDLHQYLINYFYEMEYRYKPVDVFTRKPRDQFVTQLWKMIVDFNRVLIPLWEKENKEDSKKILLLRIHSADLMVGTAKAIITDPFDLARLRAKKAKNEELYNRLSNWAMDLDETRRSFIAGETGEIEILQNFARSWNALDEISDFASRLPLERKTRSRILRKKGALTIAKEHLSRRRSEVRAEERSKDGIKRIGMPRSVGEKKGNPNEENVKSGYAFDAAARASQEGLPGRPLPPFRTKPLGPTTHFPLSLDAPSSRLDRQNKYKADDSKQQAQGDKQPERLPGIKDERRKVHSHQTEQGLRDIGPSIDGQFQHRQQPKEIIPESQLLFLDISNNPETALPHSEVRAKKLEVGRGATKGAILPTSNVELLTGDEVATRRAEVRGGKKILEFSAWTGGMVGGWFIGAIGAQNPVGPEALVGAVLGLAAGGLLSTLLRPVITPQKLDEMAREIKEAFQMESARGERTVLEKYLVLLAQGKISMEQLAQLENRGIDPNDAQRLWDELFGRKLEEALKNEKSFKQFLKSLPSIALPHFSSFLTRFVYRPEWPQEFVAQKRVLSLYRSFLRKNYPDELKNFRREVNRRKVEWIAEGFEDPSRRPPEGLVPWPTPEQEAWLKEEIETHFKDFPLTEEEKAGIPPKDKKIRNEISVLLRNLVEEGKYREAVEIIRNHPWVLIDFHQSIVESGYEKALKILDGLEQAGLDKELYEDGLSLVILHHFKHMPEKLLKKWAGSGISSVRTAIIKALESELINTEERVRLQIKILRQMFREQAKPPDDILEELVSDQARDAFLGWHESLDEKMLPFIEEASRDQGNKYLGLIQFLKEEGPSSRAEVRSDSERIFSPMPGEFYFGMDPKRAELWKQALVGGEALNIPDFSFHFPGETLPALNLRIHYDPQRESLRAWMISGETPERLSKKSLNFPLSGQLAGIPLYLKSENDSRPLYLTSTPPTSAAPWPSDWVSLRTRQYSEFQLGIWREILNLDLARTLFPLDDKKFPLPKESFYFFSPAELSLPLGTEKAQHLVYPAFGGKEPPRILRPTARGRATADLFILNENGEISILLEFGKARISMDLQEKWRSTLEILAENGFKPALELTLGVDRFLPSRSKNLKQQFRYIANRLLPALHSQFGVGKIHLVAFHPDLVATYEYRETQPDKERVVTTDFVQRRLSEILRRRPLQGVLGHFVKKMPRAEMRSGKWGQGDYVPLRPKVSFGEKILSMVQRIKTAWREWQILGRLDPVASWIPVLVRPLFYIAWALLLHRPLSIEQAIPRLKQRVLDPDSLIVQVPPIREHRGQKVENKEQLDELVEYPLLEAAKILFDKGVITTQTSANIADLAWQPGGNYAVLYVDYESLSPQNKAIADDFVSGRQAVEDVKFKMVSEIVAGDLSSKDESKRFREVKLLLISIPINLETRVLEVIRKSVAVAQTFLSSRFEVRERIRIESITDVSEYPALARKAKELYQRSLQAGDKQAAGEFQGIATILEDESFGTLPIHRVWAVYESEKDRNLVGLSLVKNLDPPVSYAPMLDHWGVPMGVGVISLLPKYQQQGIGRSLFKTSLEYLKGRGVRLYVAWIEPDNLRSRHAVFKGSQKMGLSLHGPVPGTEVIYLIDLQPGAPSLSEETTKALQSIPLYHEVRMEQGKSALTPHGKRRYWPIELRKGDRFEIKESANGETYRVLFKFKGIGFNQKRGGEQGIFQIIGAHHYLFVLRTNSWDRFRRWFQETSTGSWNAEEIKRYRLQMGSTLSYLLEPYSIAKGRLVVLFNAETEQVFRLKVNELNPEQGRAVVSVSIQNLSKGHTLSVSAFPPRRRAEIRTTQPKEPKEIVGLLKAAYDSLPEEAKTPDMGHVLFSMIPEGESKAFVDAQRIGIVGEHADLHPKSGVSGDHGIRGEISGPVEGIDPSSFVILKIPSKSPKTFVDSINDLILSARLLILGGMPAAKSFRFIESQNQGVEELYSTAVRKPVFTKAKTLGEIAQLSRLDPHGILLSNDVFQLSQQPDTSRAEVRTVQKAENILHLGSPFGDVVIPSSLNNLLHRMDLVKPASPDEGIARAYALSLDYRDENFDQRGIQADYDLHLNPLYDFPSRAAYNRSFIDRPDWIGNVRLSLTRRGNLRKDFEIHISPYYATEHPWLSDFLKSELEKRVRKGLSYEKPDDWNLLIDFKDLLEADFSVSHRPKTLNEPNAEQLKTIFLEAYADKRVSFDRSAYETWKKIPGEKVRIAGGFHLRKINGRWSILLGLRPSSKQIYPNKFIVPAGKADHKLPPVLDPIKNMKISMWKRLEILPSGEENQGMNGGYVDHSAAVELWEESDLDIIYTHDLVGRLSDYFGIDQSLVSLFVFVDQSTRGGLPHSDEFENWIWVPIDEFYHRNPEDAGQAVKDFIDKTYPQYKEYDLVPELKQIGMENFHQFLHKALEPWLKPKKSKPLRVKGFEKGLDGISHLISGRPSQPGKPHTVSLWGGGGMGTSTLAFIIKETGLGGTAAEQVAVIDADRYLPKRIETAEGKDVLFTHDMKNFFSVKSGEAFADYLNFDAFKSDFLSAAIKARIVVVSGVYSHHLLQRLVAQRLIDTIDVVVKFKVDPRRQLQRVWARDREETLFQSAMAALMELKYAKIPADLIIDSSEDEDIDALIAKRKSSRAEVRASNPWVRGISYGVYLDEFPSRLLPVSQRARAKIEKHLRPVAFWSQEGGFEIKPEYKESKNEFIQQFAAYIEKRRNVIEENIKHLETKLGRPLKIALHKEGMTSEKYDYHLKLALSLDLDYESRKKAKIEGEFLSFRDQKGTIHLPLDFFIPSMDPALQRELAYEAALAAIEEDRPTVLRKLREHTRQIIFGSPLFTFPRSQELQSQFPLEKTIPLLEHADRFGNSWSVVGQDDRIQSREIKPANESAAKQVILEKIGHSFALAAAAEPDLLLQHLQQWFPPQTALVVKDFVKYGRAKNLGDTSLEDWIPAVRHSLVMEDFNAYEPLYFLSAENSALSRLGGMTPQDWQILARFQDTAQSFEELIQTILREKDILFIQSDRWHIGDFVPTLEAEGVLPPKTLVSFPLVERGSLEDYHGSWSPWVRRKEISWKGIAEAVNHFIATGSDEKLRAFIINPKRVASLKDQEKSLREMLAHFKLLRGLYLKGANIHYFPNFNISIMEKVESRQELERRFRDYLGQLKAYQSEIKAPKIVLAHELPERGYLGDAVGRMRKPSRNDPDLFNELFRSKDFFGSAQVASSVHVTYDLNGDFFAPLYKILTHWQGTSFGAPVDPAIADLPVSLMPQPGETYVFGNYDYLFLTIKKGPDRNGDRIQELAPEPKEALDTEKGAALSGRAEVRTSATALRRGEVRGERVEAKPLPFSLYPLPFSPRAEVREGESLVPSANRPTRSYLLKGQLPIRLTVNDLWDFLNPTDRVAIEQRMSWEKIPESDQISGGRSLIVVLKHPKKFGDVTVRAIKIKGGVYLDPTRPNAQPRPPLMEEYPAGMPGRNRLDPRYHSDGRITWRPSEDQPKGALLRKRSAQEFTMAGAFWDQGLPAIIPLGYGEFTSLIYKGAQGRRRVALVIDGIPDPQDLRLSRQLAKELLTFYKEALNQLDQLDRWNKTRIPGVYPASAPPLDHLYAYGRFLRELHDRNLYHGFAHPGNVILTPQGLMWADLDYAESVKNLNRWGKASHFLNDLDTAYRSLFYQVIESVWNEQVLRKDERLWRIPAEKAGRIFSQLLYALLDRFLEGYFYDLNLKRKPWMLGDTKLHMTNLHISGVWQKFGMRLPLDLRKEQSRDNVVKALFQAHFGSETQKPSPSRRAEIRTTQPKEPKEIVGLLKAAYDSLPEEAKTPDMRHVLFSMIPHGESKAFVDAQRIGIVGEHADLHPKSGVSGDHGIRGEISGPVEGIDPSSFVILKIPSKSPKTFVDSINDLILSARLLILGGMPAAKSFRFIESQNQGVEELYSTAVRKPVFTKAKTLGEIAQLSRLDPHGHLLTNDVFELPQQSSTSRAEVRARERGEGRGKRVEKLPDLSASPALTFSLLPGAKGALSRAEVRKASNNFEFKGAIIDSGSEVPQETQAKKAGNFHRQFRDIMTQDRHIPSSRITDSYLVQGDHRHVNATVGRDDRNILTSSRRIKTQEKSRIPGNQGVRGARIQDQIHSQTSFGTRQLDAGNNNATGFFGEFYLQRIRNTIAASLGSWGPAKVIYRFIRLGSRALSFLWSSWRSLWWRMTRPSSFASSVKEKTSHSFRNLFLATFRRIVNPSLLISADKTISQGYSSVNLSVRAEVRAMKQKGKVKKSRVSGVNVEGVYDARFAGRTRRGLAGAEQGNRRGPTWQLLGLQDSSSTSLSPPKSYGGQNKINTTPSQKDSPAKSLETQKRSQDKGRRNYVSRVYQQFLTNVYLFMVQHFYTRALNLRYILFRTLSLVNIKNKFNFPYLPYSSTPLSKARNPSDARTRAELRLSANADKPSENLGTGRSEVRAVTRLSELFQEPIRSVLDFGGGLGDWLGELRSENHPSWVVSGAELFLAESDAPQFYREYLPLGITPENVVRVLRNKWLRLGLKVITPFSRKTFPRDQKVDLLHASFMDDTKHTLTSLEDYEKHLRPGGWFLLTHSESHYRRQDLVNWLKGKGYEPPRIRIYNSKTGFPPDYPKSFWWKKFSPSKIHHYLIVAQKSPVVSAAETPSPRAELRLAGQPSTTLHSAPIAPRAELRNVSTLEFPVILGMNEGLMVALARQWMGSEAERGIAALEMYGLEGKNWSMTDKQRYRNYLKVFLDSTVGIHKDLAQNLEDASKDGIGISGETKLLMGETPVILQVDLKALDPKQESARSKVEEGLRQRLANLPSGSAVVIYADSLNPGIANPFTKLSREFPMLQFQRKTYMGTLDLREARKTKDQLAHDLNILPENSGFLFSDLKAVSFNEELNELGIVFQFSPQQIPDTYLPIQGQISAMVFGELAERIKLTKDLQQSVLFKNQNAGLFQFHGGVYSLNLEALLEARTLIFASA